MAAITEIIPGLQEQDNIIKPPEPAEAPYMSDVDVCEKKDWTQQDVSYVARRDESNKLLMSSRGKNARIDAWHDFVNTLNASHLSPLAKVEAVNDWVNENIHYDKYKTDHSKNNVDWHQEIFKTLSTGKGECDDIAYLKYETLKAVGINSQDLRLVSGSLYKGEKFQGNHEILVANVDGRNLALNINLTEGGWDLPHGGVEPMQTFVQGKAGHSIYNPFDRFVPRSSWTESGTKYYPTGLDTKGNAVLPAATVATPGKATLQSPQKSENPQLCNVTDTQSDATNTPQVCIDVQYPDTVGKKPPLHSDSDTLNATELLVQKTIDAHDLNPSWEANSAASRPAAVPKPRSDSRPPTLRAISGMIPSHQPNSSHEIKRTTAQSTENSNQAFKASRHLSLTI